MFSRRVISIFRSVARPVGLVVVPGAIYAVHADWPAAVFVAFLLVVSSLSAVIGHISVTLLWIAFQAHPGLALAFGDGLWLSVHAILPAAVSFFVLLLRKPLVLSDEHRVPGWVVKYSPAICAALAVLSVGFLTASLFRSVPARYAVYGLAAAPYAWRFRRLAAPDQVRLVEWVGKATLSFCSLALVIMLVEGGVRLLLPPPPQPAGKYIPHERAFFILRPDSTAYSVLKDNSGDVIAVRNDISGQGIRDREYGSKPPGVYRIVMLGDSYTYGHGLRPEETIPSKLEALLRKRVPEIPVEVANCGVGAYAPWQERIFLRERGFPLDPDLVVFQAFPPNDITGSYAQTGRLLPTIDEPWERSVHEYRRQGEFPFRAEHWLRSTSNAYALLVAGTGLESPARRVLADCRVFPRTAFPEIKSQTPRNAYQEACLVDWYPELQEAFELFTQSVRGIRNDCEERGVCLAAYVHGELVSLRPEAWHALNEHFPDTPYEMNKDIRITNELLDALDIPRADVLEALRDHPVPEELYYIHDGHFTPLGAEVVAECLARFVQERFLPGE